MSRPLVILVVVLAGCAGEASSSPTTPGSTPATTADVTSGSTTTDATTTTATPTTTAATTSTTSTATVPGNRPEGFELAPARVVDADGEVCDVCLWVAAAPEQRVRGLMGVTDLGGADGMVFRYDEPSLNQFWMRDTPLPLSIAFFAADGSFVSATDMVPCLGATECVRYAAAGPYTAAVEVPAGGLDELLIGPGSRLELLAGACSP